ncbi:hypothetical protein [Micromonospora endophytica]|uniref:hypothetical protein n=1 Tax=Micromonospora endophytica TaxID=515350 RepID=UPI000DA98F1D|nr:hypothetical protein [Micromonospora endophytica]RIW49895.1 hypothetical protein D3H59_03830 [Micromonospora endophytica]BCJ57160.1 hypothetical protein Jiend_05820 [Micromonospora endophytica]
MLLVLNELSYRETKARREEVSDSLHGFVRLLRKVRQHRTDVALVTERRFFDLDLGDDYSVREWAGDGRNRDAMRYLRGMNQRAPFREVAPADLRDGTEYFHEEQAAEGLGTAHQVGGLAVSLPLAQPWEETSLRLSQRGLAENDAGTVTLTETEVDVRHASRAAHVDRHRQWLCDSELTRIHTGAELWEAREDIFPHLRFLPRVAGDLHRLAPAWLQPVKERLAELELTVADWVPSAEAAPQWRSKVTPESESRKALCRFVDTDGQAHLFDWHARFTPRAGRLHFRMDGARQQFVIAYIGAKLT